MYKYTKWAVVMCAAAIVASMWVNSADAAKEEPGNTPDPRTRTFPHIDWCSNYKGGQPRVLFVVNQPSSWDIYGLAMRMDMDYDIFETGPRNGLFAPATDYYHEGIRLYPQAVEELRGLLKKRWDVIAFVDTPPYCLPPELHYMVLEKVKRGTGAVTFNCGRWNTSLGRYPGIKSWDETEMLLSIPRSALSLPKPVSDDGPVVISPTTAQIVSTKRLVRTPYELPPVKAHKLGKGLIFNITVGGGNWSGGAAMQPALVQEPEELMQGEYYYSLAAKAILRAAGRGPVVKLTTERIDGREFRPGDELGISVEMSDSFKGKARLVMRTPQRDIVHESTTPVVLSPGHGMVTLSVPPLEAGRYYVDVWLLDGKKTIDWASAHVTVRHEKSRIKDCTLSKTSFKPTEKVSAVVSLSRIVKNGTLTVRLLDAADRELARQEGVKLAGTKTAVSLPLDRTREPYHVLDVMLVLDGIVIDKIRRPFSVIAPRENDLCVFTSGDADGLHGSRRLEVYRDHGINTLQVRAEYVDSALASGAYLGSRLRVNGGCSQWEGGCISGPTYPAAIEDAFRMFASKHKPHGLKFLSIGDDSGVSADFCNCFPAWVRAHIVNLSEKYRGDIRAFELSHGTGRLGAFRYVMAQSSLERILGFKLIDEEFAMMKDTWKVTYGTIAAFNRASGTTFASFDTITEEDLSKIKYVNQCLLGFRDAMKAKYGSIDKLNATWGCSLKDFEEINNRLIDTLLQDGRYGAKLDRNWYLEDLFLKNMAAISKGVRGVLPEVGIGMGAATLRNIIPESLEYIDSIMPYKGDRDIEIIRSLPHRFCGHTIGVYGGKKVPPSARENQAWEVLFTGGNLIWFWSVMSGGVMGDLSTNPGRSGVMLENIREMQDGIARALINAERQHDGIAILESRRAGAMSGLVRTLGTLESSQVGFQRIIEDLGMQYRYTFTKEVESGALKSGEFKVLILPYVQVLSDKEQSEIRAFVKQGGTVVADLRVGTRDWNGNPRKKGALDDMFGIRQECDEAEPLKAALKLTGSIDGSSFSWTEPVPGMRCDGSVRAEGATAFGTIGKVPAVLVNRVGKGRAVFLNHSPTTYNIKLGRKQATELRDLYRALFAASGVKARFGVTTAVGDHAAGAEIAVFKNGPIEYLTLEKNSYEFEKYPMAGIIQLDGKYHVYNTRSHEYVGRVDSVPVELTGLGCYVYSLLPYAVGDFEVSCPRVVRRGNDAVVRLDVHAINASPGPHTVRVDVYQPNGKRLWPIYKKETTDGRAKVLVPIALNDATGNWTVTATDVTTGRSKTYKMRVK